MTDSIESDLKLWRDRLFGTNKRKEISPGELSSMLLQPDLQKSFFNIIDRDCNGCLSQEEWTGCFSKLLGESDAQMINWFVDRFNLVCGQQSKDYMDPADFNNIVSDSEFGFRFAALVSPKSKRVTAIQLLSSLEIIASLSTDAKWLSWLKYQFTEAITQSGRLDKTELYVTLDDFVQNFYFKESFLAHRLFSYLDHDKSGYLSLHEFINGLEVVVNGTQEQKMEFLFKVFDVDNNGRIDFNELKMMLKCCMDDSPSLDLQETVDDLATVLFRNTDIDDSGDISLAELKEAFKRYDMLFKSLSVSTSIWIKPKFINKNRKSNNPIVKIKQVIENQRPEIIFWSMYIVINVACMVSAYLSYRGLPKWAICARIFGNSLNFNCAFVLVLVLRKHLTWLRTKGANAILPLDDSLDIHKIVGIVILVETLIHTIAHLIFLKELCLIESRSVNYNVNYLTYLFTGVKNIGYPTGIIELVLLIVILISAMPVVRNKGFFQMFYWCHMLTIPWLLIMLSHGKTFWVWLLAPMFCYVVEKVLRYKKVSSNKFGDTFITEAVVLPSKVVHLVIRKPPKFKYNPGDYVFINIPTIARHEWHPFSISSAPERSDFIWLHVRAVGNWTKRLYAFSATSKFDLSAASFGSQKTRMSMRSRMSMMLNDEKMPKGEMVEATEEGDIGVNEMKKAVSFEPNIMKAMLMNDARPVEAMNEMPQSKFDSAAGFMPSMPLKHKGILKVMMQGNDFNVKSFNDTLNNYPGNNNQGNDFPTESTPKPTNIIDTSLNTAEIKNQIKTRADSVGLELHQIKDTEMCNKRKLTTMQSLDLDAVPNMDERNIDKLYLKDKSADKNSIDYVLSNRVNDEEEENESKNNLVIVNSKDLNVIINLNDEEEEKKSQRKADFYVNKHQSDERMTVTVLDGDKKDDEAGRRKTTLFNRSVSFLQSKLTQSPIKKDDALGYSKMYQRINRVSMNTIGSDQLWRLRVFIDGPYGTPSYEIFEAEHAVLIASGIGITPFASILQSLMHRYRQARATCPNCNHKLDQELVCSAQHLNLKKVDFIWITREQRSLEWFISMLSQMEIEQKKNNSNNNELFLETHLYVTSAKRQSDLKSIGLHLTMDAVLSHEDSSLVDGLRQRTHHGRPNWDIVMQNLIRKQKGKINVFYCGLPSLANVLQGKCREYNLAFKKEVF